METPKYEIKDTVKYMGHQGRVTRVFKESSFPKVVWRYYVLMRDGEWSVAEESIEKLIKRGTDETE